MPQQNPSVDLSIYTSSSQRISNPFSSSASSPVSASPNPLEDSQASNTEKHSWSAHDQPNYRPVERNSSIEYNKAPTSPQRLARGSYQSSNRSSKPISELPPLPTSNSDPEKGTRYPSQPSYSCDDEVWPNEFYHEDAEEIQAKSLRLLIYLSGPVCVTSVVFSIWAVFALLLALLFLPFNMIRKSKSLREQTIDFLAPPLKMHLSFILATVRDETYSSYSLPLLVLVIILAPFVSMIVAISAWTAACFWFFAAIIGDPRGVEEEEARRSSYLKENDEDGKASVIGVRKWWMRWLTRALR